MTAAGEARVYVITTLLGGPPPAPEEERVSHAQPVDDAPPIGGADRPAAPPLWLSSVWRQAGRAARTVTAGLVGVVAVLVLLLGAVAALLAALLGVPAPGWWARRVAAAYWQGVDAWTCRRRRSGVNGGEQW